MATPTQQWISLEEVVTAYLDQSEQSPNKTMKLWNIAVRGMDDCGLDAFYGVKTILLPVNANLTVTLPEDYLQYTKIGILNGAGEVATLRRNDNISRLSPFSNDRSNGNPLAPDATSPDFFNYWHNGICGNIAGTLCTHTSGFTISEQDGLLFLSGITEPAIVLEYVASPDPDTDYKAPIQFREALIAFIAWKDILYVPSSRRGTVTDKAQRRKEYYNERRLAIAKYKPVRLQDFYNIHSRTGGHSSVYKTATSADVTNAPVTPVPPPVTPTVLLPAVTTSAIGGITTTAAASGGTVTNTGGAAVSAQGICWGTSPNPTISGSHSFDGSGGGTFVSNLTGLQPSTTYYVRAYATNSAGTGYGNEVTFATAQLAIIPYLVTTVISAITASGAVTGGSITDNGGAAITAKGVCYSLNNNPTLSDAHTADGTGSGSFTSVLTGLTPATIYCVRAYATNSAGTAYGNQLVLTTIAPSILINTTDELLINTTDKFNL